LYENYVEKNVGGNSGEYLRENWERWVYGARGHLFVEAELICGGANGAHHNAINPGRKTNDPQNIGDGPRAPVARRL